MRSRGRGFFSFNSGAGRGILSAFSVNRAFLFSVFCVDSGTVPGAARFSFTGSALFRSGTQKSRLYAEEPAERVPALSESPFGEKASEGSHVRQDPSGRAESGTVCSGLPARGIGRADRAGPAWADSGTERNLNAGHGTGTEGVCPQRTHVPAGEGSPRKRCLQPGRSVCSLLPEKARRGMEGMRRGGSQIWGYERNASCSTMQMECRFF